MAGNEFNFEELDKAVNSLMQDTEPDSTEPAVSASSEPAPESAPSLTAPAPVSPEPAATIAPSDPAPAAPPATDIVPAQPKPSGRFMDVVHPSSDMRTPPQSVSREGKELTPSSSVQPPVEPVVSPTPPSEQELTPEPSIDEAPLASPFLPDAQVEKRPLGAVSPAETMPSLDSAIAAELSAPSDESTSPTADESEQTTTPDTSETEATPATESSEEDAAQVSTNEENIGLPEELRGELVAIESADTHPDTAEENTTTQPVGAADLGIDTQSSTGPSLMPHSIPQQYEEQPSSGDVSHAPIYDDQASAQPLTQHKKKKTGLYIAFGVGVVVISVAAAVGVYFLQFGS